MTDHQLNISEDAICNLSEALGESEKRIIDLFQLGCEIDFGGELPSEYKYLFDELRATFDAY